LLTLLYVGVRSYGFRKTRRGTHSPTRRTEGKKHYNGSISNRMIVQIVAVSDITDGKYHHAHVQNRFIGSIVNDA
jgi:hypothetical protein